MAQRLDEMTTTNYIIVKEHKERIGTTTRHLKWCDYFTKAGVLSGIPWMLDLHLSARCTPRLAKHGSSKAVALIKIGHLQPAVANIPVIFSGFLRDSHVASKDFLQDNPVVPKDFLQDILPENLKLERFFLEICWKLRCSRLIRIVTTSKKCLNS